MRGWAFPLGKYFGVELRLHTYFVLLMPCMMLFGSTFTGQAFRGFALWLLLLAAVLVRETGRCIALAVAGRTPSRLVLLPTGAVPVAPEEGVGRLSPGVDRLLATVGPLCNFFAGITMALLMYAATASINLFEKPWFTPSHLLRSAIWCQILLGGLNLLPAFPLDAGVLLRTQLGQIRGEVAGTRAVLGISQSIALILVLLGALMGNTWVLLMGVMVLLSSRGELKTVLALSTAESITMEDVMLREFSTLSASDTLEQALRRSVQSLQEVFPVVRGPVLVGAITRNTLMMALRVDGDGYVQSVMEKQVEVVAPGDLLAPALRRMQGYRGAQLLHVLRDERLVGIVTPANLAQAMAVVSRSRRMERKGRADRRG